MLRTNDFDYDLPEALIAQAPAPERDASRLLVLNRATGEIGDRHFADLPAELPPSALLVINDSRVFPARVRARRPTGGAVEVLLVQRLEDAPERWRCLCRASKPLRAGQRLTLEAEAAPKVEVEVEATLGGGEHRLRFYPPDDAGAEASTTEASTTEASTTEASTAQASTTEASAAEASTAEASTAEASTAEASTTEASTAEASTAEASTTEASTAEASGWLLEWVSKWGETPLPPYIRRPEGERPEDRERYQTVYADPVGSVAAPTAGLHFTPALLELLQTRGHEIARVTLHVGPGTFRPVRAENPDEHRMDAERVHLPAAAVRAITQARADRRPVVAVGTTTVRALEGAASRYGELRAGTFDTELFIRPGFAFRVVDGLITNFHLPRSTLLMLVSALAGRAPVLAAYRHAVSEGYRFYSYGDAMLIH